MDYKAALSSLYLLQSMDTQLVIPCKPKQRKLIAQVNRCVCLHAKRRRAGITSMEFMPLA